MRAFLNDLRTVKAPGHKRNSPRVYAIVDLQSRHSATKWPRGKLSMPASLRNHEQRRLIRVAAAGTHG